MRPRRWFGLHAAALVVTAVATPLVGQLEAFDREYQAAEQLRSDLDPGDTAAVRAVRAAYRGALRSFLRCAPDASGYAGRLAAAGWCAVQVEDWRQADELLRLAEDQGAGSDFVAATRIRALCAADRGDEALALARRHAPNWPVGVRRALVEERLLFSALLPVADQALRRGQSDVGLWAFRYAATEFPAEGPIQANLGLALRNLGQLGAAERTYRRALELDPKDHTTWNDLGLLLKGKGDYEAAAKAFSRSHELDPEPPTGPATTNLAVLEGRLGRRVLPDSTAAIARRLTLRPGGAMATRVLLDRLLGRVATPTGERRGASPPNSGVAGERARGPNADRERSTR